MFEHEWNSDIAVRIAVEWIPKPIFSVSSSRRRKNEKSEKKREKDFPVSSLQPPPHNQKDYKKAKEKVKLEREKKESKKCKKCKKDKSKKKN